MPRPSRRIPRTGDSYGTAKASVGKPLRELLAEKGVGGEKRKERAADMSTVGEVSVDRVTITLPLPSSDLHAHAKGVHWGAKAKATKEARTLARETVEAYCPRPFGWEVATIRYRFYFPDETRRDALNFAQGCKGYVDGLVDAGLIRGDHWRVLGVEAMACEVDRERPRVELVIERAG